MRPRRRRMLATAVVLPVVATGWGNAAAAPVDAAAVRTAPARGETTTVVVSLRQQADLDAIDAPTRRRRLRAVVTALQDAADTGQQALTTRLDTWAAQGRVTEYEPLWVTDAVSVTATPEVIDAIAARADVVDVVPDAVVLSPAYAPAEPNVAGVRAPAVWDLGETGGNAVVATLDSGADVTHPDLAGRWRGGAHSWFDPYGEHPAAPVDLTGHGTATLGTLVGADAGGTSIGVAPGARWIAARVFDDRGASTVTAVHQAFQWLLDPDGDPTTPDAPNVVNGSWVIGTAPGCDLTFQPDVQALGAAGILPVFAAGNFGPGAGTGVSPANYPESLAVGSLTTAGSVRADSSRGPATCGGRTGPYPDLVAPGQDVLTADRYGLYQVVSGTSIAAPHVAGTLALLLSSRPGLGAAVQRDRLLSSAVDLGPVGPDNTYGAGRVDALAAYEAAVAPQPDFTVTASPATASVTAGDAATFDVDVVPGGGFTGDVALTTAAPAGMVASVAPTVVTGGAGAGVLTVTTSAGTAPGTHPVTVRGESGVLVHEATVELTVLPPPPPPPPPPVLELSTLGSVALPGIPGSPDDADVYAWDGVAFSRTVDVSDAPYGLPSGADVDGFSRLGRGRFVVSFQGDVRLPGPGRVQDEDVVLWDGRAWSVWFDGTSLGLTSSGHDLDAVSVVGTDLYFSTLGPVTLPDVGGTPDDADVYRWDGQAFSRVWDASLHGVRRGADVDGLDMGEGGSVAVSFNNASTALPGGLAVQDEDVVACADGAWAVLFDGTALGLTSDGQDIDAFDLG
ncbi:S8 family serine peptidase [Nocardioides sp. GCM10027113]|uniref:S8 family serine peptidase n=1 Tax=unclassified Nocardioides TaxID=2615069 RepID=UPI003612D456